MQQISVGEMFQGRSVFVTGASGFIGRVLIEKLLRNYQGIKTIYLLVRTKKSQAPQDRLHKQILDAPIFDKIKSMPNSQQLLAKLVVVAGDIGKPSLGISEDDMAKLLSDETLSIVFHSAATVRFDEPLKLAMTYNVLATKEMIKFCKMLPNIVSICHVSTAYVNSDIIDSRPIQEAIYPMDADVGQMIRLTELMDKDMLQTIKPTVQGGRPNTYTFTKALAERLLVEEAQNLPVVIVRPSIVTGAWKDPLPGWVDNLNGPSGLIVAISKGLLRSLNIDGDCKADIVPVDIVVNTMIASAYYAAIESGKLTSKPVASISQAQIKLDSNSNNLSIGNGADKTLGPVRIKAQHREIPIFHCNSGDKNPVYWRDIEGTLDIIRKYPSTSILRYPAGSFKSNYYHDLMARFFFHYLFGLMIDTLLVLSGHKRFLMNIYTKVDAAFTSLRHFANQNYEFETKNISKLRDCLPNEIDKKELFMDIENIKWRPYWDSYILGTRRYISKEPDETLTAARKTSNKAYWTEVAIATTFLAALVSFIWYQASPMRV